MHGGETVQTNFVPVGYFKTGDNISTIYTEYTGSVKYDARFRAKYINDNTVQMQTWGQNVGSISGYIYGIM